MNHQNFTSWIDDGVADGDEIPRLCLRRQARGAPESTTLTVRVDALRTLLAYIDRHWTPPQPDAGKEESGG